MVRPEVTGERPLEYSQWHRRHAPSWCYCTDLDFIEWRSGRGIVAVMEVKRGGACLTGFQLKVLKELSEKLGVPAYLIRHNEDLTEFRVEQLHPEHWTRTMNSHQYREFLASL